jgi:hypothetical protein
MSTRGRKSTKKVETVEVVEKVVVTDEEETKEESEEENKYDAIVKKTVEELKEMQFETNDPEVETPTPQPKTKSIADFDYDEVERLDVGAVKAVDSVTLLKLLIVRGKKVLNPTLWKGAQETLRRLNGELETHENTNPRRDFNQGRNFNQGRGEFNQGRNFNQGRTDFNQGRRDFNQGRNRFPVKQAPQQPQQFQQEQNVEERQTDRTQERPRERNFRQQGRDNSNFGSRFQ